MSFTTHFVGRCVNRFCFAWKMDGARCVVMMNKFHAQTALSRCRVKCQWLGMPSPVRGARSGHLLLTTIVHHGELPVRSCLVRLSVRTSFARKLSTPRWTRPSRYWPLLSELESSTLAPLMRFCLEWCQLRGVFLPLPSSPLPPGGDAECFFWIVASKASRCLRAAGSAATSSTEAVPSWS